MNERISELTTRAQDGFKNLTKEAQKFADVDPFKANDASLIASIEEMKTALKDYSPVWQILLMKRLRLMMKEIQLKALRNNIYCFGMLWMIQKRLIDC